MGDLLGRYRMNQLTRREVLEMAADTGFRCEGQWIDGEWPFAQNLLVAI